MLSGHTCFFSSALQEEVITDFSTVPEVGWGVMVPQPLSELTAQVSLVHARCGR
jgi:hypothetical protein